MSKFKDYIGDGVYADFDGFNVVLTTENGYETTNTIYLEPDCIAALNRYVARVTTDIQTGQTGAN